ncbi:MAG: S8 family peptidase [Elusimicrobia bacterium]|nr:S8 family peptidase [Elusimicrobiota bacterium]
MKRIQSLASCAVLLSVLSVAAKAVEQNDFDTSAAGVSTLLAGAKRAARANGAAVPGSSLAGAPAASASEDQYERVIVVFADNVSKEERLRLAAERGGTAIRDLALIHAVSMVVPKSRSESIASTPSPADAGKVVRTEDDLVQNWLVAAPAALPLSPALAAPRLPAAPSAEELSIATVRSQHVPWGVSSVNAQALWRRDSGGVPQRENRGRGVKVAVVDTGIDVNHANLNVRGGYNAIAPGGSWADDQGHGTHVAGTIGATDMRDRGVIGVAPEASLYAVKVLDSGGSGSYSDIIAGIQWCVENRMQVINMSLGASRGTESLAAAMTAAHAAGVTIIAAAGNSSGGPVGFPAAYPEAIAVGSIDINERLSSFSSVGPQVAVVAPGSNVTSTQMGGGYATFNGTSMATPHIAGLAVLAIAAGARTPAQVRNWIVASARPLESQPAPEDAYGTDQVGAGLPDASRLGAR